MGGRLSVRGLVPGTCRYVTVTAVVAFGALWFGAPTALAASKTISYSGSPALFTVPGDISQLTISAYGAGGGFDNYAATQAPGAEATATISVTADENLELVVGGGGGFGTDANGGAGYNGGGPAPTGYGSTAGGGATDIRTGACAGSLNCGPASRILVAGGGGGVEQCGNSNSSAVGGGPNGGNGFSGGGSGDGGGGTGATQTGVGQGGSSGGGTASAGGNGSGATGGAGGAAGAEGCGAGGGGGGYYGGGGGGGGNYSGGSTGTGGGGGGGSSYGPTGTTYVAGGGPTTNCTIPCTGANGSITVTYFFGSTTFSSPTANSIDLGGTVADNATATGYAAAGDPTGTVSFKVCGPVAYDAGCASGGTTVGTASTTPGATDTLAATSDSFKPTQVGDYCFAASYGGDSTYNGSSDTGDTECFIVDGDSTTTSSSPGSSSVYLGAGNHDSAMVTGNATYGSPTGTLYFYACGPLSSASGCLSGGTLIGTASTAAGPANTRTATSDQFTASSPGTYCFRANYDGDPSYGSSADAGAAECFTVLPDTTATSSAPSASSVVVGTGVSDTATVTNEKGSTAPTGSVTFGVCGPLTSGGGCTGGAASLGTSSTTPGKTNTLSATSDSFTAKSTGHYCFEASYVGDSDHGASSDTGSDECFEVTAKAVAPTNTALPAISGTAKEGETLTCSEGTWSGTSPLTYSYQWNASGGPIAGATSSTYKVPTIDEGQSLTCTVTAKNSGGSASATSGVVKVAIKPAATCPAATGHMTGTSIGLLRLGMTRRQAQRAYHHYSSRGYEYKDYFCLTPRGVRVGLASPKLLGHLPASQRSGLTGKVVWVSTSNLSYSIDGVRADNPLSFALKRLGRATLLKIGANDWYLIHKGSATIVLKVRQGQVQEIGVADSRLTKTRAEESLLMHSFY
jgi:hypothetical protein